MLTSPNFNESNFSNLLLRGIGNRSKGDKEIYFASYFTRGLKIKKIMLNFIN